jgi:2,4-dienoyl-CoA reductase [(3E)-enoyl-CoA-producing], peroxisomal
MTSSLDVFRDGLLQGHVALITGGGTGICKGIARAFARLGADVAITSRKAEVLAATAAELSAETGREILAVATDVRDPDACARAVAATVERFGSLDTLVNGAAGNFLAPAAALSPNGFGTVIDIDLKGSFNVSRAAFEALRVSGRGAIVNISATLQYHGTPLVAHASAAKAGIDSLTRSLAVEWGPMGIRVVGIAPGPIGDTEGMRRLAPPGEQGKRVLETIPLRRLGAIDDIAAAAVFLRSGAASWVTGTVLVVDGGNCVWTPPLGVAF